MKLGCCVRDEVRKLDSYDRASSKDVLGVGPVAIAVVQLRVFAVAAVRRVVSMAGSFAACRCGSGVAGVLVFR